MTWGIAIFVGALCIGFFLAGLALGLSSVREPDPVEQWKHTRRELDHATRGQHLHPGSPVRATSRPADPPPPQLRLVDR